MITLPLPAYLNSKSAFETVFCITPVSICMSSMYALVACILFHVSAVVPKLYFAVSDGNKSLVTSALNVTLSVSASPIVILPFAVIFPVAVISSVH